MEEVGQADINVEAIRGKVLEIFPNLNYETLYNSEMVPSLEFFNTIPEIYHGEQADREYMHRHHKGDPTDMPTFDLQKAMEGVSL